MQHNALIRLVVLSIVLLTSAPARADWINLTGAETAPNITEITVLDDRVRVILEVYVGDLATFKTLVPDDWLKPGAADRPALAERLRQFSDEILQIITPDGARLQATLILAEPRLREDRASPFAGMINPMTRQRVPGAPEDKRVLYAALEYPFTGRPASLTLVPPLDENGVPKVTIGFIAYHKSVPVIDFRYLSQAATLDLDWDDPWYTRFANPNLKRHHQSALMSFLYVAPREVRHEILIRVRDLQDWTDLGLRDGAVIGSDERAKVKAGARAFLESRNPLEIDGAPVTPVASRAEFLNISLTGLQVIEGDDPLDPVTAILGIILSYPVAGLPQHVTVQWDLFNERVGRIPATSVDPAGSLPGFIDAGDPVFEWRNYLRQYEEPRVSPVVLDDGRTVSVPVLSVLFVLIALGGAVLAVGPKMLPRPAWIALSGASVVAAALLFGVAAVDVVKPFAGPPEEAISARILTGVLANVNHAYLENDAAQLRKALEVVIAAESLTEVGEELDRALAIQVVGGSIARVDTITDMVLEDITPLDGQPGFRSLAEWTARASAGHWGHVHRRTIRFQALVELVDDEGAWKLAGITVTNAEQLN